LKPETGYLNGNTTWKRW